MRQTNRRTFLATSCGGISSALAYHATASAQSSAKNDRPQFGLIGAGYQPDVKRKGRGFRIGQLALEHADLVAVCEVDSIAGDYAVENLSGGKAPLTDDYRKIIDRDDIDAVVIGTPDHWHAKIAIEAMRAGKDVYCEKPVAVTIDEGKRLRDVTAETGQVFQVGTQQRSEYQSRFLTAIAMVRDGRLGKLSDIRIGLGTGAKGEPLQTTSPPSSINWERWLGPAPMTDYIARRAHRSFRWWWEYAGGQICDWGAHHVDIAQWAIDQTDRGPSKIEGTAELNQPLTAGMPTDPNRYNTPVTFSAKCHFDGDIVMTIDSSRNGITFEGDAGRIFVNRGTLEGTAVNQLASKPLADDAITSLYGGKQPTTHMANFFDCVKSRQTPVSDIASHHRILTTCHLANICLRLGRRIQWDPKTEQIIGDDIASGLMTRSYRKGYEIA